MTDAIDIEAVLEESEAKLDGEWVAKYGAAARAAARALIGVSGPDARAGGAAP